MNEAEEQEITTYNLDHYGLVAAICKKLKIAERIDKKIPNSDPRVIVSTGTAVVAMILNGLGFINHRLYMVSNFYESKPVGRLLRNGIKAENLSDNILGKALDTLDEYGQTKLFFEIVLEILQEFKLFGKTKRLDSTSINVCGDYEISDSEYNITYGYSKDGHADMKQFMINLATTGKADMPFWFEIQDGNSSDKKTFRESAKDIINRLKNQIGESIGKIHVADSAFYTAETIKTMENMKWLSRVPENIKEAKSLLENSNNPESMIVIDKNYSYTPHPSEYGGIKQRWIIVFSKTAFIKEKTTFENKLIKITEKLEKEIWHLENNIFTSNESAIEEISKLDGKYKYHKVEVKEIETINVYENRGRHKKDEKPVSVKYKVKIKYSPDKVVIQKSINCKGKFILATNELETNNLPDNEMLSEYKDLQGTERGFRFLKDPWFMASDVYLKKESRIASLMMIMTLCLVVYNFSQHHLRSYLKENNETLPNQLKKQIQNPTTRWIYQMMMLAAISVVRFQNPSGSYEEVVTNIKPVHKKIISIFGNEALNIYGFK